MDREQLLVDYLIAAQGRYLSYHNHKETLAYAAVALYLAATGAVITSEHWPSEKWELGVSMGLLLVVYAMLHAYLYYTLDRRRWSSIRLAGCSNALDKLVKGPEESSDRTVGEVQRIEKDYAHLDLSNNLSLIGSIIQMTPDDLLRRS